MAEVSWIKLKVGMFDDSKIKYIEALPERDTIITVWVKLLTLAGKYNERGYIMLSENLPYNAEMLANEFNRPINSIRLALQTFQTLGMVEDVQGVYKVSNWEKHQNLDSKSKHNEKNRLRQQRYRERKKQEQLKNNVTVTLRNDTEEEEEKEEEKEVEKEVEKERDKDVFSNSISYVINFFENNLTPYQIEQIGYAVDDIGVNADEVVQVAVDYTKEKGGHVGYLIAVLNNWAKENVKTEEEALNKIKPKKSSSIDEYKKKLGDDE
ncbi:phage replisome organizer N-terminal domain-containing protein [Staphylococcus pseudintermedius]|uniref:Replication initiation protein n=6 Tax=root TaxID=1 RepID=A0A1J0MFR9_9CAUD|nr:phage replisome organizer N-terminal domain-containing protein [Staphylococcus pseudintermedius]YP_010081668.1 replisome organizer N-terminal domain-containing protein [Staphylococcus phage SN8]APD19778.1 replication initiation protein [Staphylococcus phage SpT5]ASU01225.1 replication initiation protein [Staphylococcus phage SN13]ASU01294.1 replication initiation protein [Staphylococcus phage SN11]ASU01363.1 replication initiation protein [Staphylococcus phage SN10]ASU01432.1 replication i